MSNLTPEEKQEGNNGTDRFVCIQTMPPRHSWEAGNVSNRNRRSTDRLRLFGRLPVTALVRLLTSG